MFRGYRGFQTPDSLTSAPGAAVELAKKLGPGHTIVTILCDSGFRYGSNFFNKQWMTEKGLYDVLPPEHRVGIE